MNRNNAQISIMDEIIVDNFAGGCVASSGIELANFPEWCGEKITTMSSWMMLWLCRRNNNGRYI